MSLTDQRPVLMPVASLATHADPVAESQPGDHFFAADSDTSVITHNACWFSARTQPDAH